MTDSKGFAMDNSGSMAPCPFCGAMLEPHGSAQYNHPSNSCWLASVRLLPLEYASWNARTAQPGQAAHYKAQRDSLLEFIKNAPVSSGVCCCGDDMEKHGNPMYCGHNPVDMWDHSVRCYVEDIEAADAQVRAALAIPAHILGKDSK